MWLLNGIKFMVNWLLKKKFVFILWLVITLINPLTACVNSQIINPPLKQQSISDTPQTISCNFSDLTGYVHAENNINAIQGLIVLSNYTENPCLIDSAWVISVADSQKKTIISTEIDLLNTNIDSENFLSIEFTWENFCQQITAKSFTIRIMDNGTKQNIHIPIEDPNGNLISTPPVCIDHLQKESFLLQISQ